MKILLFEQAQIFIQIPFQLQREETLAKTTERNDIQHNCLYMEDTLLYGNDI